MFANVEQQRQQQQQQQQQQQRQNATETLRPPKSKFKSKSKSKELRAKTLSPTTTTTTTTMTLTMTTTTTKAAAAAVTKSDFSTLDTAIAVNIPQASASFDPSATVAAPANPSANAATAASRLKSSSSNSGVLLSVRCEQLQLPSLLHPSVGVDCAQLPVPRLPLAPRASTPALHLFSLRKPMSQIGFGTADGRKYLADYHRCWPPPWFIMLISLIEIACFAYDYATVSESKDVNLNTDSIFIYRPDRRLELWRFLSYMVLHANCFHLGFNIIIQLFFGLPLEAVHGSLRIASVYLAGVLAGSLGTSVVDSTVYLVGASGGVYALLAAHLANILMNFSHMRNGVSQLVSVAVFVSCDLGYALYCKYATVAGAMRTLPTVSYIAHMTGAMAGFTVGLLVLQHFDSRLRHRLIRWLALGVYAAFTLFAIVFNLINTMTAQMLAEEEGEVIKQRLLHDFGIA